MKPGSSRNAKPALLLAQGRRGQARSLKVHRGVRLMPITFRSSTSEAPEAEAVAPEMQAFEGTGHRNRWRPGSMASVVVPRNAMLAKNKAVLAAAHLFAVRNDCISPALAVRTFKSLIGDLRYPAVDRRTGPIRILLVVPTVSEPRLEPVSPR